MKHGIGITHQPCGMKTSTSIDPLNPQGRLGVLKDIWVIQDIFEFCCFFLYAVHGCGGLLVFVSYWFFFFLIVLSLFDFCCLLIVFFWNIKRLDKGARLARCKQQAM